MTHSTTMRQCTECKGKGYCGRARCPIIKRFHASLRMKPTDSYMGGAPSVFVGSYHYPNMAGGPLLTNEIDTPTEWVQREYSIDDIVGMRARTIRNTSRMAKLECAVQEIALSSTPLDVEAHFEKPLVFDLSFDGTLAPIGLSAQIRRMEVLDNAKTPRAVDRVTSDTDLKATDAVLDLFSDGIDVYQISQLLTAGLLGVKRRIVPTRWAITAVDDMIARRLKEGIPRDAPVPGIEVYHATLYANQLIIALIPGPWQFEMIEIWEKQSLWAGEHDTILRDGERMKKSGYSPIAGAYYSTRLAVTEYLGSLGRSARVLVVRRITNEYWAPLGTWVIREAARKAFRQPPLKAETATEAAALLTTLMGSDKWLPYSNLMREIRTQKTLFEFKINI